LHATNASRVMLLIQREACIWFLTKEVNADIVLAGH
jgi:hypothetical protein